MELAVRAFVIDEDEKILLVKHASDQMWVLPGGHVEAGESVYDALKRELREEVDLSVTVI